MEAHKLRCQHIPGLTHLTIIPRHSSFYNPLLQAPACTSAMMAFIQRQQAWYKQPPQKVCFQVAAAAAIPTRFAARIVSAVLRQSRFGTSATIQTDLSGQPRCFESPPQPEMSPVPPFKPARSTEPPFQHTATTHPDNRPRAAHAEPRPRCHAMYFRPANIQKLSIFRCTPSPATNHCGSTFPIKGLQYSSNHSLLYIHYQRATIQQ